MQALIPTDKIAPASKINPYDKSRFKDKIMFSWITELIQISSNRRWAQSLHYNLSEDETIKSQLSQVELIHKERKTILGIIFRHFNSSIICFFLMNLLVKILLFAISLTTAKTYKILESDSDFGRLEGLMPLILTLVLGASIRTVSNLLDNYFLYFAERKSIILKTLVLAMIQKKINKFGILNSDQFDKGYITNLVQIDAEALSLLMGNIYKLMSCLVGIFVGSFSLAYYAGWRVTIVVFVSYIILNLLYIIVFKFKKIVTQGYLRKKDQRMSFFKNIIQNIDFIKIKAQENFYAKKVFDIREEELDFLRSNSFVQGASSTLAFFSFTMATVIMMLYYVKFETPIYGFAIFTAIKESLSNVKRSFALFFIIFNYFVGFSVSVNRIDDFLNGEEVDQSYVNEATEQKKYAIVVKNGDFKWKNKSSGRMNTEESKFDGLLDANMLTSTDDNTNGFFIKDVNLKVKNGEKVMIIGKSCSGKSSLLYSILGEMIPNSLIGKTEVIRQGRVAFLSQERWIIGDTIKENITLGNDFDEALMQRALNASQLLEDLANFDHGLDTVLGDSGDTISGGQRARIALARCFYQKYGIF